MDLQFIWNMVLTVGLFVIGAFGTLGKMYLDRIHTSIEKQIAAQNELLVKWQEDIKEDICELENKLENSQEENNKFRLLVYKEFVSREEYIRTTQGLDAKIDRVLDEIGAINVNVARLATTQEVKGK